METQLGQQELDVGTDEWAVTCNSLLAISSIRSRVHHTASSCILASRTRARFQPASLTVSLLERLQPTSVASGAQENIRAYVRVTLLENLMHGDKRLERLHFIGQDGLHAQTRPERDRGMVVPGEYDALYGEI